MAAVRWPTSMWTLPGQIVCSKLAKELGIPYTGHRAGEAGDTAWVMCKTSVALQNATYQISNWLLICYIAAHQICLSMRYLPLDRMDSICSMSCTQLGLGEILLCISSAKMPCKGSRDENFLCLARKQEFFFSWKETSSLWWKNTPRQLSSKDKTDGESEQERQRQGLEDS